MRTTNITPHVIEKAPIGSVPFSPVKMEKTRIVKTKLITALIKEKAIIRNIKHLHENIYTVNQNITI
jgi:hypothetical protein